MKTYCPEGPEFKVIANPPSDFVFKEKKEDIFEIACQGTDDDLSLRMLRSKPTTLNVNTSVPAGVSSTNLVVKTSSLVSLFAHLGILPSS